MQGGAEPFDKLLKPGFRQAQSLSHYEVLSKNVTYTQVKRGF
jgi:hypothetical protein